MPIENAVAKKFREQKKTVDRVELRRACREYAAEWVETQRNQFKRLGIRGDWHDPYLTMSRDFEASIVEVFGELAAQGFIYRGLKPVFWCGTCETALADAEVEYEPHVSNSIYVRFPLKDDPNGVFGGVPKAYAIIWTTTPWTIPANLAIAAHPDSEYAVVHAKPAEGEAVTYLVAVPLVESVMKAAGVEEYETVKTVKGEDLARLVFSHPLFGRNSPLLLADYVTMDTGTGLVHTAPGHGKEDFDTGLKYGLEVLNPGGRDGPLYGGGRRISWRGVSRFARHDVWQCGRERCRGKYRFDRSTAAVGASAERDEVRTFVSALLAVSQSADFPGDRAMVYEH